MIKKARVIKIIFTSLSTLTPLLYTTFTMAQTIPLNKLIGQFDEKQDSNFVALDSTILPVNKKGMYLQKEPTEQLIKAYNDFKAAHPDIPFIVVSATRNYTYQNGIWQRKWDALAKKINDPQKIAQEILKFSSMPGTSRHHWGTDIDITSVSSDYFKNDKKGIILYKWLQDNLAKYGFCQAFNEGRKGGYQPEEWHWSYKPIASQYIAQYKATLETNPQSIMQSLNFIGHDKIELQRLIKEYVLTVNQDCY
ncbi:MULTISPECIES: M15 family metallopeptidase [unclassified Gilliamella]|uniref:M15 family metallopeptidase n=1 Tax=unclassified Gilliamella TaxID=2685620 RepID=UPI0022698ABF|nr:MULTISPECIES: M15 family metallopeptidase [unclassified Gilliamella]MCX8601688.1 M15 family metallopeptidase [Gilliamella sp. B3722]MCX8607886.1 M15 family metallopeptidase [Gilliamella sp. B3771]MCX8610951.1 M15 family metallopeptidase [Gilliamella sp. B3891]MCX8613419.1 M15 family metallopeptidase [Gilliamella sp. B3773]MCX8615262.1 M15 family metallopeptidase [Gilliamella sp. B3770]